MESHGVIQKCIPLYPLLESEASDALPTLTTSDPNIEQINEVMMQQNPAQLDGIGLIGPT